MPYDAREELPKPEVLREDAWLRRKMSMMGGNQVGARRAFTRVENLNEQIHHIAEFLYPQMIEVDGWLKREAFYRDIEEFEYIDKSWQKVNIGDAWGDADHIAFFKRTIEIPREFDGLPVILHMTVGGESTVFVNGQACDSLDPHRHDVPLTHRAKGGESIDVMLETHVWSFPDDVRTNTEADRHTLQVAEIRTLDLEVQEGYYDFRVAWDAALAFEDDPELSDFILTRLQAAMDLVDLETRNRAEFKATLKRGSRYLRRELYASDAFRVPGKLWLVAHSHLDIAFHWWIHHGARKTRRTMVAQLSLIDQYPEFLFSQSQPKTFNDIKIHWPEVHERIKKQVDAGRLELIGGMWIEPDGNLPSGESFVRQVLLGKRFFKSEFGVDTHTCWVPDIFGCTWILPQILKRSGIEYFVTHKQSTWNDTNPWPYNLFVWRGPDGSEVLGCIPPSHFIGQARPDQMRACWKNHKQKDLFPEMMLNYGWGNGGGGPTPDMVEYAKRLKKFPGLPESEITTAEHFLARVDKHRETYPVWEDELYLEMHRGTPTTKGILKKRNRQTEIALREAEALRAIAAPAGLDPARERFTAVWQDLLVNQFHDILPGSHVHKVAEGAIPVAERAHAESLALRDEALAHVTAGLDTTGDGTPIVVTNTLNWTRTDVATVTVETRAQNIALTDDAGKPVPFQEIARTGRDVTLCFTAHNVPALGQRVYRLQTGQDAPECPACCATTRQSMENAFFKLRFNRQGYVTHVLDKRAGREVFAKNATGNHFQLFNDQPGIYDAWDIALSYREKQWPVKGLQSITVVENGPVRTVLRVVRKVFASTITQDVILYADLARIDFQTTVDWQERQKLLKVGFPVDVHADAATYDLDYGTIQRPTHRNTSWAQAKFEVCAHKWVDVSEPGYGVSLLNDCKYGHDIERLGPGDADGNLMRLTLLKGSCYPDETADIGEHTFTYALYPHQGDWREAGTVRQAHQLNAPLIAQAAESHEGAAPGAGMLTVDAPNVYVGALKMAEDSDDIIVRLIETHGARVNAQVQLGFDAASVMECDLMERDEQPIRAGKRAFTVELRPNQIRTFKIKRG